MRNLKFIAFSILAALSIAFVSCEKEEGTPTIDSSLLVGTWKHSWSQGTVYDPDYPDNPESWDGPTNDYYMVFIGNGKGYFEDKKSRGMFNWSIDENRLILEQPGGSSILPILKIDATTFQLEMTEQTEYNYYSVETYTRVN